MMEPEFEDAYNALVELGLKPYEARVYLAIADGRERTANEIVALTGVPQPRVYETLESLASKGLVEVALSKPKRYRAIEPSRAIEILAGLASRRIESNKERALKALSRVYLQAEDVQAPRVRVIKNKSEAILRARKMLENASYDALVAGPPRLVGEILPHSVGGGAARRLVAVVYYEGVEEPLPAEPWLGLRLRSVGVIPLVIADSARAVILRESYALEIAEEDLIRTFLDFYYHALWRVSSVVKPFEPVEGFEYTATSIWLLNEVLKECLGRGLGAEVTVAGVERRTGRSVTLTGRPAEISENGQGVRVSLVLEVGQRKITVGGLGARLEDVEGRVFRLKVLPRAP